MRQNWYLTGSAPERKGPAKAKSTAFERVKLTKTIREKTNIWSTKMLKKYSKTDQKATKLL